MTSEASNYVTVAEIAERLRVTPRTVGNWIEAGLLPAFRFGGNVRVEREELDAFIERSKVSAP
jgi:excisionase family DNA binding protein